MPVVARGCYSTVLKMKSVKSSVVTGLGGEDLCAVSANHKVKIDELHNASMVSEYDHTTFRTVKSFVLAI